MNPRQLTDSLISESKKQGFELVGISPAVAPAGFARLADWIDNGFAGEMHYVEERKEAYRHPDAVLEGVVSVAMLALNYNTGPRNDAAETGSGRIARYAWGECDYHDLVHGKLKQIIRTLKAEFPGLNVRGVVDTAPLLEREFAQLAGMGWFAKNTMLINKQLGSWFFLAGILLDQALVYDAPHETAHCGTCTACIAACPTDAFPEPHVLDATKCISYLTIEHRTAIPMELRPKMDDWLLGCDVCQDVCPWNNKASVSSEPSFQPLENHNPIDLIQLFELDDETFRARFRKTPLWRPKRRGILRNAAIALGNHPSEAAVDALKLGLDDVEPLVRGASAWALGRQKSKLANEFLHARQNIETDEEVKLEIAAALEFQKRDSS